MPPILGIPFDLKYRLTLQNGDYRLICGGYRLDFRCPENSMYIMIL